MRYKPTLAEFVRYWEPTSDDPISMFLTGVYLCGLVLLSIFCG